MIENVSCDFYHFSQEPCEQINHIYTTIEGKKTKTKGATTVVMRARKVMMIKHYCNKDVLF